MNTVATIGTLSASQTDFVLPVASNDLYKAAIKNDVVKFFYEKGIIKFHSTLSQPTSAGSTLHLRNLFEQDGLPLVGDIDPYENTKAAVYGDRTITLRKLNRPFEFTRSDSFTQQLTLINLQEGHEASNMDYFSKIVLKGIFSQAGSNNGTSIACPPISATATTADEILSLTGNNTVNFNPITFAAQKRYHIANGVATPQALAAGDVLTTDDIMRICENIALDVDFQMPFNQLEGGMLGTLFIAQTDLFNLMKEAPSTNNNWVFSKAYEYAAQAGKIQTIGMMQMIEIIGIPLYICVFPDSYFHPATNSSTQAPVANTRRLFCLGKNALDMVLGKSVVGKNKTPFKVRVDNNWKPLGTKSVGNVEGTYGIKQTQLSLKNNASTLVPLAAYTLDVYAART